MDGFHCTTDTEAIVYKLVSNMDHEQPLKVIDSDCQEALAA